jgi:adenylosuccinate synthase
MSALKGKVQIIQGGQYGSEAKGAIAAYLVTRDCIDYAVRTGATNAGHSVVFGAVRFAMQQLPVGWVRPTTRLVLGAGALIDPAILMREVEMVSIATGVDVRNRLFIDYRAYIHRSDAAQRSKASDRHHLIGATGKGCSEALVDRIRLRGIGNWTIDGVMREKSDLSDALSGFNICDTEHLLNNAYDKGETIQLEGTQGTGLDLYLGPYPYTTHKQTTPAQWMNECGLSPSLNTDIVMVCRTFPIRVAGNSGPMGAETSWPDLAREINHRRESWSLPPIVREGAIDQFEDAVRHATSAHFKGKVPPNSDGLDQHLWDSGERLRYREALSEIHKCALSELQPDIVAELSRLFEMTTVTKKLRRIARIDKADLATFSRQVRPTQVAVTFMNYVTPENWYDSEPVTAQERYWLQHNFEKMCHAPVTLINRGPDPDHIIEVG